MISKVWGTLLAYNINVQYLNGKLKATESVDQEREADEHERDPSGGLDEPASGIETRQVDARAHGEREVENYLRRLQEPYQSPHVGALERELLALLLTVC